MCYNKNVSIFTYLLGMSGSMGLLALKKIPESLFYAWVAQMQILEYSLWNNQPCDINKNKICTQDEIKNCNSTNMNTTTTAMIVNHLEPFILFISILIFGNKKLPIFLIIFVILFLICLSLYTINIIYKKDTIDSKCTTVSEKSNPHLEWKWNTGYLFKIIYILFVIVLMALFYYGTNNNILNPLIVFFSFAISYFIYKKHKSVGAMWCFMASFAPFITIFFHLLKKK